LIVEFLGNESLIQELLEDYYLFGLYVGGAGGTVDGAERLAGKMASTTSKQLYPILFEAGFDQIDRLGNMLMNRAFTGNLDNGIFQFCEGLPQIFSGGVLS